jgi:hypothetical protein
MSKSNILQKIREIFMEEETIEENSFQDGMMPVANDYKNEITSKLLDGTEVKILTKGDAVSVGDMVLVKVGEGYEKAPEGQHELEGGLVVYVDAEGYINELETQQTNQDEMGNSEMEELFGMIEKMADMVKNLQQEIVGLKRVNQSLEERFEKFSNEPVSESFTEQNKPRITTNSTREERLKFFSDRK